MTTTTIRFAEEKLESLETRLEDARNSLHKFLERMATKDVSNGLETEYLRQMTSLNVKVKAYAFAYSVIDRDTSRSATDRLTELALLLLENAEVHHKDFHGKAEEDAFTTLAKNILFGRTI